MRKHTLLFPDRFQKQCIVLYYPKRVNAKLSNSVSHIYDLQKKLLAKKRGSFQL